MLFDTQTIVPASSSSLAEFVTAPPWMRSSISCTVAHSAPSTSTDTSTIESARSQRERRLILPGSPAITATSNTPSINGSNHCGPNRTASGSRIVRNIAASTALAIGQRASPTASSSVCPAEPAAVALSFPRSGSGVALGAS
jgi:hypothetical protein